MFGWLFLCCNNASWKYILYCWKACSFLATLVMKMDLSVAYVGYTHEQQLSNSLFSCWLSFNVFCWIGWSKNKQDKHMEEPDTIKPAFHFLLILITHCCGMTSTASQSASPHFKPTMQLSLAESRLILCKPWLQICKRQHSGLMCWGGEETVFLHCCILELG